MGRLIDVSELHNIVMQNKSEWGIFATPIDHLVERLVMQVETADAIPKADYENCLKIDKIALLTELQSEIEEIVKEELIDKNWANGLNYSEMIIQQKINSIKSESER